MLRKFLAAFLFAFLGLGLGACSLFESQITRPVVVIVSPPSGSTFTAGEQVVVQSTSADPGGVVRVALIVDGVPLREDPSPTGQGQ